jgi:hypothetical protein
MSALTKTIPTINIILPKYENFRLYVTKEDFYNTAVFIGNVLSVNGTLYTLKDAGSIHDSYWLDFELVETPENQEPVVNFKVNF